ncbi:SRPBCC family protein [Streptomyces sp. NPDC046887]|uniref:SRPBCC family protein n=1 Tax=Streptomyces sp. NPDC046887 TaxID=3155472 RepID=UPI003409016E
MASLTLHATGPAPPGEVWRRYTAPRLWSCWSPQIRAVRTDAERIRPGLRGEVVSWLGIRAAFTVESVDEADRSWSWRVRLGPVRLRLRHEVRPGPGGGTRTVLRLTGPAPALAAYALPARWALHRLLRTRLP